VLGVVNSKFRSLRTKSSRTLTTSKKPHAESSRRKLMKSSSRRKLEKEAREEELEELKTSRSQRQQARDGPEPDNLVT
jgi:hypothetical protein